MRTLEEKELNDMLYIYKHIKALETEKRMKSVEKMVSKVHKYLNVFSKKASEDMPEWKSWDHAIKMKKGYISRKGKLFLMSIEKQKEVSDFVDNQLWKGYIQPS